MASRKPSGRRFISNGDGGLAINHVLTGCRSVNQLTPRAKCIGKIFSAATEKEASEAQNSTRAAHRVAALARLARRRIDSSEEHKHS